MYGHKDVLNSGTLVACQSTVTVTSTGMVSPIHNYMIVQISFKTKLICEKCITVPWAQLSESGLVLTQG